GPRPDHGPERRRYGIPPAAMHRAALPPWRPKPGRAAARSARCVKQCSTIALSWPAHRHNRKMAAGAAILFTPESLLLNAFERAIHIRDFDQVRLGNGCVHHATHLDVAEQITAR